MNVALVVLCYGLLVPVQLVFAMYLIYRLMRLHKLSSTRIVLPGVLKLRLALIAGQVAVDLLELVLSQADGSYWLNQSSGLAFLALIPIGLQSAQVATYYCQYKKRVPYNYFNALLWGLYLVTNSAVLVTLSIQGLTYFANYLVFTLKLLLSLALLVLCLFKGQDYSEFYHLKAIDRIRLSHYLLLKSSKRLTEKTDSVRQEYELSRMSAQQQPLLFQFIKELSKQMINGRLVVHYKLSLSGQQGKARIISRTEDQLAGFTHLAPDQYLAEDFSERIDHFERQLNSKTRREGVTAQLTKFLQLNEEERRALRELLGVVGQGLGTAEDLGEEGGQAQSGSSPTLFKCKVLEHLEVQSHLEYKIEMRLAKMSWNVQKRFAQFDKLRLSLKGYGLRPLSLYKGKDVEQRKRSLEAFCQATLNQKLFWKPELWEFFGMQDQAKRIATLFEVSGSIRGREQKPIVVKIPGFQMAIDPSGKTYALYRITVAGLAEVKHRFSDFQTLHRAITDRWPDRKQKLPSLPPKVRLGQSKEQRARLLEVYLQELLSLQGAYEMQQIECFLGMGETRDHEGPAERTSLQIRNWSSAE